ncbi:MAG: hypothetical protein ACP5JU_00945 [Minisyncoccia bacterium]
MPKQKMYLKNKKETVEDFDNVEKIKNLKGFLIFDLFFKEKKFSANKREKFFQLLPYETKKVELLNNYYFNNIF